MIILNDSLIKIDSGKSKTLKVIFVALGQTGIFGGKIKIGSKEILVLLNIRTKLLLFDSNVIILNKDYILKQGDKLKTEVTLIPLGEDERLDVTLNYIIKDYNNNTYLTKSETLLVENKTSFKRDFDTGILPVGSYFIGLELIYPNGVATSSASFTIVEKFQISFGEIIFYLITSILIIAILILIYFLYMYLKKGEKIE